ncbi:MAG: ACT domain-containing protein, partial [Candidatus Firestonebacteria bacterium]
NYNVPMRVRSSFNDNPGTLIVKEAREMEKLFVTGITYNKEESKITVLGIKDTPGMAAAIFTAVGKQNVNVDMIVQDVSEEGVTNISFTVPTGEVKKTVAALESIKGKVGIKSIITDNSIAKVSAVGVGMKSHSGVAAMMFEALAEKKINIGMISTSEIKISCVIEQKDCEEAVKAIHKKFNLGKK